jgi:hypothetical protein
MAEVECHLAKVGVLGGDDTRRAGGVSRHQSCDDLICLIVIETKR